MVAEGEARTLRSEREQLQAIVKSIGFKKD